MEIIERLLSAKLITSKKNKKNRENKIFITKSHSSCGTLNNQF